MTLTTRMISVLTAIVLFASPGLVSAQAKTKAKSEKAIQGTIVTATDGSLIVRKGKADMTLTYDSASRKPATLTPGTAVLVHYRDEKNQHVVTAVEVTEAKTTTAKKPSK